MQKVKLLPLALCFAFGVLSFQTYAVTESELIDAILGRTEVTNELLSQYDVNSDGKIDVADVIAKAKADSAEVSLVGDAVGIMQSTIGISIEGQQGSRAVLPLKLTLTETDGVISGMLVNDPSDSDGQFSLYFPSGNIQLESVTREDNDVAFSLRIETLVPTLSQTPMGRNINFSGSIIADGLNNLLIGTYNETILGFSDSQNNNVNASRNGIFILYLENQG